jgi:hypothetical protein
MLKPQCKNKSILKNEKGMAMLEAVSLMVIFTMLLTYALGYWGAIHSATLNSIAARTYAFETFRNRADTTYHRDNDSVSVTEPLHGKLFGFRFHGINSEKGSSTGDFEASRRPIAFGREFEPVGDNVATHNNRVYEIRGRNREGGVEVNPIWIKVGYGLCVTASCGGDL